MAGPTIRELTEELRFRSKSAWRSWLKHHRGAELAGESVVPGNPVVDGPAADASRETRGPHGAALSKGRQERGLTALGALLRPGGQGLRRATDVRSANRHGVFHRLGLLHADPHLTLASEAR
jgi:hypothetical protein